MGRLFRLACEHRNSLREIDTPTQTGVASPRLSALLFLFTGLSQRLPDNGRQSQPMIACGDYNFDWSVTNGEQSHDVGFDRMVADSHWTWVRPTLLVRSQCNPNFDSVLDFVFVNTAARPLALTSVILQEANDCGNAAANPDHRPLRAEFEFGTVAPAPTRAELLQWLEAIERQIQEFRTLIQRLP